jgi:hypothetical protein
VGHNISQQSKAKQSKAKQSKAKQSKAKQSKAKQSKTKQSKAKQYKGPISRLVYSIKGLYPRFSIAARNHIFH